MKRTGKKVMTWTAELSDGSKKALDVRILSDMSTFRVYLSDDGVQYVDGKDVAGVKEKALEFLNKDLALDWRLMIKAPSYMGFTPELWDIAVRKSDGMKVRRSRRMIDVTTGEVDPIPGLLQMYYNEMYFPFTLERWQKLSRLAQLKLDMDNTFASLMRETEPGHLKLDDFVVPEKLL